MNFEYESITHIGSQNNNDDYYVCKQIDNNYLFVVADGCGGYPGAELASRYFGEGILAHVDSVYPEIKKDPGKGILHLMQFAQQFMAENLYAANKPSGCTTVVLAWLNDTQSLYAHVGDSRIYHLSSNEVVWHTKDHSVVQNLIDAGEISEAEAKHHILQYMLSQAVDVHRTMDPTISIQAPLHIGEGVVLASDGYWRNVESKDLYTILNAKDLKKALTGSVEHIVKSNLELDNVTAIFVRAIEKQDK